MSRKINSPKTEIAVLRGICSKNLKLSAHLLSTLNEDHFSSKSTKDIFNYVRKFARENKEIPSLRILAETTELSKESKQLLKDGRLGPKLRTRADCDVAVTTLDEHRKMRIVNDIGLLVSEALGDSDSKAEDVLKEAAELLAKSRSRHANVDELATFGYKGDSLDLVKTVLKGKSIGQVIPTGYKAFDEENGGMFSGSLFIFGANSGAGKSHLSVSLAINMVSMGYKVVIVPLEMSKEEMVARMVANIAEVDSRLINTGKLTRKQQKRAYRKFKAWEEQCAEKGGWFMIYRPDRDVSIEETYEVIDAFNPDVGLVDYVTLLKEDSKKEQWKHLSDVARYAKINAETNKRLNILVAQINDDGTMRYSRALTEHANNSWVWLATEETKQQGVLKIKQPKARNHSDFPFTLGIEYKYSKVYDLEHSGDRLDISTGGEHLTNLAEGPDV